tara:strand:+ start:327 stop:647 length:321 start_codon:yes stop_codon:yes gene_type:complete
MIKNRCGGIMKDIGGPKSTGHSYTISQKMRMKSPEIMPSENTKKMPVKTSGPSGKVTMDTDAEIASAKAAAVKGGFDKVAAEGVFKDKMSKDMGSGGVLYKKYCRK